MTQEPVDEFAPLKITCTSSDCENDLHCFLETAKMRAAGDAGRCRACGIDLIDWGRLYKRDITDVEFTFAALQRELVRHHFWHVTIDERAINHARRKGLNDLRIAADRRIRKSVGSAQPVRDGIQTPREGNIIYYAQHAVACCCRRCLESWHAIPRGCPLSDEQITYLTDLVMMYIQHRLPTLQAEGERVPSLHR